MLASAVRAVAVFSRSLGKPDLASAGAVYGQGPGLPTGRAECTRAAGLAAAGAVSGRLAGHGRAGPLKRLLATFEKAFQSVGSLANDAVVFRA